VNGTSVTIPDVLSSYKDWIYACPYNKERNAISSGIFKRHIEQTHPKIEDDEWSVYISKYVHALACTPKIPFFSPKICTQPWRGLHTPVANSHSSTHITINDAPQDIY
jgi:hypothetical protein